MLIFHVIPVSPGSIARGIYVIYVGLRDKSFKDYNIAVVLAFFKIVGYLAFPIQMTYRYPALARFMAAHWATDAVHTVPVFGERGALFEHSIFCAFYNWPLTIRRRMNARSALREKLSPRYWHVLLIAVFAGACLMFFANWHFKPAAALVSLISGSLTTIYCGRAAIWERFSAAAFTGILTAIFFTFFITHFKGSVSALSEMNWIIFTIWHCFTFALMATIGAILTELSLPDVENQF
jgi:hypothetical protein